MRPIDSEFAISYLLDDCDDCPENKDGECMTQSNCFEVKQMAIKALRQNPIIKGKWIYKNNVYYCSECNNMALNYDDCSEGKLKTDFCPFCGADMREELLKFCDDCVLLGTDGCSMGGSAKGCEACDDFVVEREVEE